MGSYLLHGKFTAKPNHRDDLAKILIEASGLISYAPGCRLYLISQDDSDPDSVYVSEWWDSKDDHDKSLKIDGVMDLIMKGLSFFAGKPEKGQELTVLGGKLI